VSLFYPVALLSYQSLVREEHHWLKRSVTGKRGEPLARRRTMVREEHHWLKRGVTGKRR
jgi:hypothetical protein